MVIPSTPGLPWFLRTRFLALWRFSPSHTFSISCSVTAGLSGTGFATNGSALGWPLTGVSPRPYGSKASEYLGFLSLSTHELPVLLGTAHRSETAAACCESEASGALMAIIQRPQTVARTAAPGYIRPRSSPTEFPHRLRDAETLTLNSFSRNPIVLPKPTDVPDDVHNRPVSTWHISHWPSVDERPP